MGISLALSLIFSESLALCEPIRARKAREEEKKHRP